MRRFWLPHGAARTFSNSCTLRNSCMRSYTQLFRTPEFKLSRIALPELEPQDEIWTGQLPGQRLFADSREPGHGPHPLFPADVVDTRRMAWLETCLQSSTCRYMICWVPSRCGHSCDGTHGKVSMLQVERAFDHALCRTPLRRISLSLRGRTARFGLKMEEHGVTGSVKARTAVGLLRELHRQAPLAPGTVVVESTSGNLGLAMAHILPSIDCVFLAVVDLKTPTRPGGNSWSEARASSSWTSPTDRAATFYGDSTRCAASSPSTPSTAGPTSTRTRRAPGCTSTAPDRRSPTRRDRS